MASSPSLFQTFPVLLGPSTVAYFTLMFSLPPLHPRQKAYQDPLLQGSLTQHKFHASYVQLYLLFRPCPGLNSTLVCQKCKFYSSACLFWAGVQISAFQIFAVGFLLHNSWDSGQYSCLPAMVWLHNSMRSCYLHSPSQNSDFFRWESFFFLSSNLQSTSISNAI